MKITYLIGAGASANVFPLNAKTGQRENDISRRTFFSELDEFRAHCLHKGAIDELKSNSLQEIINNVAFFGTPDLCSKYFLEAGYDFKNKLLITLLSNYFSYKQQNADQA